MAPAQPWQQHIPGPAPHPVAYSQPAYTGAGRPAAYPGAGRPAPYIPPGAYVLYSPPGQPVRPGYPPPAYAPAPFPTPGFAPPGYPQPWGVPVPKKKSPALTIILLCTILVLGTAVTAAVVNAFNHPPYGGTTTPGPIPGGNQGNRYTPAPPDMNPDDPAYPKTYEAAQDVMMKSAVYDQTLPAVDCNLGTVDLATASVKELEDYLNPFLVCLMYAWYGPMADAGLELPRPSVTVYTEPITNRCGVAPMKNAFYCPADQQIYYAKDLITIVPKSMRTMRYLVEAVLAHEFGHHVQHRAAILYSMSIWKDRETEAGHDDVAMQLNRRMEMQADCFAGLFLHSVSGSTNLTDKDDQNIRQFFDKVIGDPHPPQDHGAGPNRARWVGDGLGSATPGVCQTFAAPDKDVE